MTGLQRFHDGATRASQRAKKLPVINPDELKHIVLTDAPPKNIEFKASNPNAKGRE